DSVPGWSAGPSTAQAPLNTNVASGGWGSPSHKPPVTASPAGGWSSSIHEPVKAATTTGSGGWGEPVHGAGSTNWSDSKHMAASGGMATSGSGGWGEPQQQSMHAPTNNNNSRWGDSQLHHGNTHHRARTPSGGWGDHGQQNTSFSSNPNSANWGARSATASTAPQTSQWSPQGWNKTPATTLAPQQKAPAHSWDGKRPDPTPHSHVTVAPPPVPNGWETPGAGSNSKGVSNWDTPVVRGGTDPIVEQHQNHATLAVPTATHPSTSNGWGSTAQPSPATAMDSWSRPPPAAPRSVHQQLPPAPAPPRSDPPLAWTVASNEPAAPTTGWNSNPNPRSNVSANVGELHHPSQTRTSALVNSDRQLRKTRSSSHFDPVNAQAPSHQKQQPPTDTAVNKAGMSRLFNRSFADVNRSLGLPEKPVSPPQSRATRNTTTAAQATGIEIPKLPKWVKAKDLLDKFSEFGTIVNVGIPSNANAYVDFEEPGAAEKAVDSLKGTALFGQTEGVELKLRFPDGVEPPTSASQPPTHPDPATTSVDRKTLHVPHLPSHVRSSDLEKLFSKYGPLKRANIIHRSEKNASFGFVSFKTEAGALKAIEGLKESM
ncbi:Protein phosphatase PP2A regulatory subunit B, partial [Chytridiales sp. JEL 0842]